MRSPAQMSIIQIDITNDCFNRCSNCSRFSGNHKKPFYMDYEIFKKACESLRTKPYPGMIGIIGGEPTLHPDFDRLIRYYDTVIPRHGYLAEDVNMPIKDIGKYHRMVWEKEKYLKRRGLWTSLGPGYAKNYELIRNVFEYQCINDHKSSIMHQASMITRKELGISDEKWIPIRDACWLQNNWSASITPKGAFFCEIAGALDMLLEGSGGWPIEAGWWKRQPSDFEDQLHWCELCSFCLKTPYSPSHDNIDTVSPEWNKRLEEIESTKKRIIFDTSKYYFDNYIMSTHKTEPYLKDSAPTKRINKDTSNYLNLNKIFMVIVCIGYADKLAQTLPYNKNEADGIVIVTDEEDIETQELCKKHNLDIILSKKKHLNGAFFNKGAMINEGIEFAKSKYKTSWILLIDADILLPIGFKERWIKMVLTPGTLYYVERIDVPINEIHRYIANPNRLKTIPIPDPHTNRNPWGYFQLFNLNAFALRGRKTYYSEEYLSAGYVDGEFIRLWHNDRRYFIKERVIHLPHGTYGTNWNGIVNK